jgi:hypothetical protein
MNNLRFNRAVSALVKGYLNHTLIAGSSTGCACANIVAETLQIKLTFNSKHARCDAESSVTDWYSTVFQYRNGLMPSLALSPGMDQINKTGYSITEFTRIEQAFEENTTIPCAAYANYSTGAIDADQYTGLLAVVKVLHDMEGIAFDGSLANLTSPIPTSTTHTA